MSGMIAKLGNRISGVAALAITAALAAPLAAETVAIRAGSVITDADERRALGPDVTIERRLIDEVTEVVRPLELYVGVFVLFG